MSFHLSRFHTQGFRNLLPMPIELHPRFNFFCGENGQGKTNLLEAIYFLFTLRPLRQVRPQDLLAWTASEAQITGHLCGRVNRILSLHLTKQRRDIFINHAPPLSLDDYFTGLQIVAFTPEDIQLLRGAPQLRRRFLDRAVFNTDLRYLKEARHYLKLLQHRNALLKQKHPDPQLLEVFDAQFAEAGTRLIRRRVLLLHALRPHLQEAYERIFPDQGHHIDLAYQSSLGHLPPIPEESSMASIQRFEEALLALFVQQLAKQRPREIERRTALLGPHLDDLSFSFSGRPFKQAASQGQSRALILALKIAEIAEIKARTGEHPLLILDDVAGELDPRHSAFFFNFLEETDGQVLLSTTDLAYIQLPALERYPCFQLQDGAIQSCPPQAP